MGTAGVLVAGGGNKRDRDRQLQVAHYVSIEHECLRNLVPIDPVR